MRLDTTLQSLDSSHIRLPARLYDAAVARKESLVKDLFQVCGSTRLKASSLARKSWPLRYEPGPGVTSDRLFVRRDVNRHYQITSRATLCEPHLPFVRGFHRNRQVGGDRGVAMWADMRHALSSQRSINRHALCPCFESAIGPRRIRRPKADLGLCSMRTPPQRARGDIPRLLVRPALQDALRSFASIGICREKEARRGQWSWGSSAARAVGFRPSDIPVALCMRFRLHSWNE